MAYKLGFTMDQIAGHITNYYNLRSVIDNDPETQAEWHELYYYKSGGLIEQAREKVLRFVPSYATGIMRGSYEMYRALHKANYDALFTNASVAVFFGRAFRKTPTLIDFDSTPLQIDRMFGYSSGKTDPGPIAKLKWRLFRNMLHSATLLQAWSEWAKESAVTEYGVPAEKIVVNPPGLPLDYWKPAPEKQPAPTPYKVLFVGGDFQRKGGDLLLKWYENQTPGECELHLVTKEPVPARPGIYVYNNITPNSGELLRLYQSSHLFILPSLGECFGIATIEAMACGLPVIASDVGGTKDIIVPGRNGYIIPANNQTELNNSINQILANPDREAMGRQSRILAEERFDIKINATKTLNYLKQISKKESAFFARKGGIIECHSLLKIWLKILSIKLVLYSLAHHTVV